MSTELCWICKNKVQPNVTQCKVEQALVVHCATHTAWCNLKVVTLRLTAPNYGSVAEPIFVEKVRKRRLFSWSFISATVFVTVAVRKVTTAAGSSLDVSFSRHLSSRPQVALDSALAQHVLFTCYKAQCEELYIAFGWVFSTVFSPFLLLLSILLTMESELFPYCIIPALLEGD